MPRQLRRLLFVMVLLGGCSLLQPEHSAPLPGGGYWQPLAPAQLGRSLSAVQKVLGQFGEQRALLVFYVEVEGDRLALVATTPDGTELFSLAQRGAQIDVKTSPLLPKQLRPQSVLADLQIAFWPALAVQEALRASGLQLEEVDGKRIIHRGGDAVIEITYGAPDPWRGTVQFEQRAWGYRYSVDTVQLEP